MSLNKMITRLQGVKKRGRGRFIACCPSHDDSSPSLSIRECEDGRVLIHCFAGCGVESVLSSMDMKLSELMPSSARTLGSIGPTRWLGANDALEAVDHESLVVAIIGADFLKHRLLDEETWNRLASAVGKINEVRAKIAPARYRQ